MSEFDMNRTYNVGDRVETGLFDGGPRPAVVIETRLIQQIRLRYDNGCESLFNPSYVYRPWRGL